MSNLLDKFQFEAYCLESRIHPLKSISNTYLKRDDELSCMISGSKLRKYASLIPHLKNLNLQKVGLIGGAYSNNIVGLSQLLIENNMQPILFLRKPSNYEIKGNLLLIELLNDKKNIHWIERNDWSKVEEIADSHNIYVIPEGAIQYESLIGAMTLSSDILRNEKESNLIFQHIFIEAGTGLQAIALILGHGISNHSATIHVLQLAPSQFEENLKFFKERLLNEFNIPDFKCNYKIWKPVNAPSFGSVNKKILNKIASFAKNEGVILDPIYSAKLIIETERILSEYQFQGSKLIVHSGGSISLFGYL